MFTGAWRMLGILFIPMLILGTVLLIAKPKLLEKRLNFAIKKIGIDSIMFGSDYPYENFKESVEFVRNLPVSEEDKEKIFYRNAEKYLINIDG